MNLLCRRPASGTNDFNLGTLRLSGEGKVQNGNSGLIIPPPQDQYCPKNKLNNQHQQRIAQCVDVAMHVRVGGLLGNSGHPQRLSVRGREGTVRLPGSPQPCDAQLGNQKPLFIQSLANRLDMVRVKA